MQAHVPIHLLGKHTAYAVKLTNPDFREWDAALACLNVPEQIIMSNMAKATLNVFRSDDPTTFYRLYGIPEEKQNEEEWFGAMLEVCKSLRPDFLRSYS